MTAKREEEDKPAESKKEETAQPARRARAVRREETLTRKERREKEKAQIAAYERKRAMSKGGGFSVFLMTALTVAFDVLGLMLCAVRGDVLDPQAFMLLMVMAPLAMLTTLVLPRFAPVEPLLMALTNLLCGVSVVILYTVAPERGVKQTVFYVAGLVLMLLMSGVVSRLKKWRGLTGLSMVLVPPVFDNIQLLDEVEQMLRPLGFGRFSVTTAEKHDEMIAFTSQLAHIVSNAYIKSPTAGSHKGFSAGSYKDLTRVAWLNPQMWTELFLENDACLVRELDILIENLTQYRTAIADGERETLCRLLDDGRRRKEEVDG